MYWNSVPDCVGQATTKPEAGKYKHSLTSCQNELEMLKGFNSLIDQVYFQNLTCIILLVSYIIYLEYNKN